MTDPFDLDRFVHAQDAGDTYARACRELHDGQKVSHWMWFVFPQIAGLGRSSTAQRYAITSLAEARAYLAHDVLGPRLLGATQAVVDQTGLSAEQVFGGIDAVKLRSCMTLFAAADPTEPGFTRVLADYFGDSTDAATEALITPTGTGGTSR